MTDLTADQTWQGLRTGSSKHTDGKQVYLGSVVEEINLLASRIITFFFRHPNSRRTRFGNLQIVMLACRCWPDRRAAHHTNGRAVDVHRSSAALDTLDPRQVHGLKDEGAEK